MTRYFVYDVFTKDAFGGNPLAIVLDAQHLDEAVLQPIAREFGFSETVFVLPPAAPDHAARLRIFTPTSELPFAGHPTVGAAVALADEGRAGDMVLELGVGPIAAQAGGGCARFTTAAPIHRGAPLPPALVARCAGLPEQTLRTPPVTASVGVPFVFAELTDLSALALAAPDVGAFREAAALSATDADLVSLYCYVRDGAEVRARMFAPLSGIPEDPATGSAAAALAAHLADGGTLSLSITQGVEMGRPSRIELHVADGAVTVAGAAIRVMEGRLVGPGLSEPATIG